ncbi:MAG: alanine--glyoxylate aminotransferase family protein [archaeon]
MSSFGLALDLVKIYGELNPPARLLLGPGPSNVDPRVVKAMSSPIVGHLDPYFTEIMNETIELLRYVFKTKNRVTIPLPGTGSAGMEAALCNLIEPGDEVIVGQNGYFGERLSEIASRCGGRVIEVKQEWGKAIAEEAVEDALRKSKAKVVAIVHAETSTGVLQPLSAISRLAHEYDAQLVVDAVTSLGGCELDVDALGIDVCYSGSQKCLNCPPGLAPITFNERALEAVANRKTKVQSWYFDMSLMEKYSFEDRAYHYTAPISMIYALREALRIIHEEGLEERWVRHKRSSQAFINGIEAMGLNMYAEEEHRLPSLNSITIPKGVSDANVRATLLNEFNVEIGGGIGLAKGKMWRVGLMGVNSNERMVVTALESLERSIRKEEEKPATGEGVRAAIEFFSERSTSLTETINVMKR